MNASTSAIRLYPVIIVGGLLQAFGPPMNGQLRQSLVNPWLATLVSVGLIVALFLIVATMFPRPLPTAQGIASIPWWAPLGGIIGAVAVDDLGYNSIEAVDGATAMRVIQSDARIDLLVTDVGLPGGMNGRQIADAARSIRPGLKVLFITGSAENAVLGNGNLGPGMQVLTKPFALEDLAARIRELVASGESG